MTHLTSTSRTLTLALNLNVISDVILNRGVASATIISLSDFILFDSSDGGEKESKEKKSVASGGQGEMMCGGAGLSSFNNGGQSELERNSGGRGFESHLRPLIFSLFLFSPPSLESSKENHSHLPSVISSLINELG